MNLIIEDSGWRLLQRHVSAAFCSAYPRVAMSYLFHWIELYDVNNYNVFPRDQVIR